MAVAGLPFASGAVAVMVTGHETVAHATAVTSPPGELTVATVGSLDSHDMLGNGTRAAVGAVLYVPIGVS